MIETLKKDADEIVRSSLQAIRPDENVRKILEKIPEPGGRSILVAVGKAAFAMAESALGCRSFDKAVLITKYGHVPKELPGVECYEASHPLLDKNGVKASKRVLEVTEGLKEEDAVFFLLSGGASALFEVPAVPLKELQEINGRLLKGGASIQEINAIRKRLSLVKGGRFALHCHPAKVYTIVLSDVLGDRLDTIGSGPTVPDLTDEKEAFRIAEKYHLQLSKQGCRKLREESVKDTGNGEVFFAGNLDMFLRGAEEICEKLGYRTKILEEPMTEEASVCAEKLAKQALEEKEKTALIRGGEPVVHVKGKGLGGRAQELALTAAGILEGKRIAVFSFGSDGTDGPTDADGGYVDGETASDAEKKGINIAAYLEDNDAYHCLKTLDGLFFTGPTGSNVNDLAIALIEGEKR